MDMSARSALSLNDFWKRCLRPLPAKLLSKKVLRLPALSALGWRLDERMLLALRKKFGMVMQKHADK